MHQRLLPVSRTVLVLMSALLLVVGVPLAQATTASPGVVSRPAIVGGDDAPAGAWPAAVAIGYAGESATRGFFCGGTLVAATWVVTAAHCLERELAGDLVAHVGATVLSQDDGTTVGVRRIVRARWIKRLDRNDIAMLELSEPVGQTPMRIAGSQSVYVPRTPATILGWGSSRKDGRGFRDHLQQGAVKMAGGSLCQWTWGHIATRLQVCAGTSRWAAPVDSCSGDSGGPLVVYGAAGEPLLAGVVSFGGQRCAVPGQPGVYTKAAAYLPWILGVMQSV